MRSGGEGKIGGCVKMPTGGASATRRSRNSLKGVLLQMDLQFLESLQESNEVSQLL